MHVADTHAWLWHLADDERLGPSAKKVLQAADRGEEAVLLPTIVVVESVYIAEKRDYDLAMQEVVSDLNRSSNYHARSMDSSLLSAFTGDDRELSIHDKIIVLTAEQDDATLLSKDGAIEDAAGVDVVWWQIGG